MPDMTPADPNSPLMRAWTEYKQTDDYVNTRRWAAKVQHVDGSLWAAFERGFAAASAPRGWGRTFPRRTAMPDQLDPHTLRVVLAEAWWRGRQSANARQGEWAGPELRERCEKDILDAVDALTDAAAPRPVAEQRCNGCGHQWTGPAPVVLCGECWRLAWPFVFGGVRCPESGEGRDE